MADIHRYARQIVFEKIGGEGQHKLLRSGAAIVGMGALGTAAAESLCRAGVGFLRLIDRDTVSLVNLHRQVLYTEEDARRETPKAAAAAERLARINSSITIEPVVADVNAANIEAVISGVDIALDGSDNFELRFHLMAA
jgi:adenylyltransferase/sulfurtransferase